MILVQKLSRFQIAEVLDRSVEEQKQTNKQVVIQPQIGLPGMHFFKGLLRAVPKFKNVSLGDQIHL